MEVGFFKKKKKKKKTPDCIPIHLTRFPSLRKKGKKKKRIEKLGMCPYRVLLNELGPCEVAYGGPDPGVCPGATGTVEPKPKKGQPPFGAQERMRRGTQGGENFAVTGGTGGGPRFKLK